MKYSVSYRFEHASLPALFSLVVNVQHAVLQCMCDFNRTDDQQPTFDQPSPQILSSHRTCFQHASTYS